MWHNKDQFFAPHSTCRVNNLFYKAFFGWKSSTYLHMLYKFVASEISEKIEKKKIDALINDVIND